MFRRRKKWEVKGIVYGEELEYLFICVFVYIIDILGVSIVLDFGIIIGDKNSFDI